MSVGNIPIYDHVAYLCDQLYNWGIKDFDWLNYDEIIETKSFSTRRKLKLENNTSLIVFEEYKPTKDKLTIVRYYYSFYDSDGKERFRADNSEHHDVLTTPHHIHDFRFKDEGEVKPFYGQDRYNPDLTEFFEHIRGNRL